MSIAKKQKEQKTKWFCEKMQRANDISAVQNLILWAKRNGVYNAAIEEESKTAYARIADAEAAGREDLAQ